MVIPALAITFLERLWADTLGGFMPWIRDIAARNVIDDLLRR
jgi:hypothetical protein